MAASCKSALNQPKVWLLAASARWLVSSLTTGLGAMPPAELVACDQFGDWDLTTKVAHRPCRHWFDDLSRQSWQASDEIIYGGGLENQWELLTQLAAGGHLLGFAPHQTYRTKTPEIWSPILRSSGISVPDWITVYNNELRLNLDLSGEETAPPSLELPQPLETATRHPSLQEQPPVGQILDHRRGGSTTSAQQLNQLTQNQHWLLKPRRGAGGHQIRWWPSTTSKTDSSAPLATSCFLQRYIPGPTWSASFLATAERCLFIGACRQLIGQCQSPHSPPFQYQGAWGPLPLEASTVERLQHLGKTIAQHFAAVGLFGVDLIGDPAGDWSVVEINPRPTSSMELLEAQGTLMATANQANPRSVDCSEPTPSLVQLHRLASLGLTLPDLTRSPTPSKFMMKQLLYHRGDHSQTITPKHFAQLVDWQRKRLAADIPHLGSVISPGQPVCTLFAESTSPLEARRLLNRRVMIWQQLDCA